MSTSKKTEKTGSNVGKMLASTWTKYSFIFVFIIILIVYAITISVHGNVFKFSHISAILSSQNTVIVGMIALGMALIIITGQIDLSVGSSLVLSTGACIMAYNMTGSGIVMLIVAILAGALCGLINGALVGLAKMPPFIVTLGTMLIYRSLTLSFVRTIDPAITGSGSSQFAMISDHPSYEFLRMKFGTGSLDLGIKLPYITFLFVALLIAMIIISKNTKYGKSVYAVGSNEKTTHLVGVNVQWVKVSVFVLTGIMVGFASFVQACKIGNVTPASSGKSYEMYAIASVVLGGVSMAGGRGNLLGVFFGALSYTTINFIIVSIPALSPDIQDTFQGLVLIAVIFIQTVGPVIKERFLTMRRRRQSA
ncbi:ABC transporter permease [Christensenellaceae bacterium OttesenSCG-928-L17]|nr:ABC transporter permease [Christensenellaceae bacterium OttesenSCG-928-L17]